MTVLEISPKASRAGLQDGGYIPLASQDEQYTHVGNSDGLADLESIVIESGHLFTMMAANQPLLDTFKSI